MPGVLALGRLTAGLAEQLVEALVTVGLVGLLLEGALVELLQTERAGKVFRMELLEHGCNTPTCRQGRDDRCLSRQGTRTGDEASRRQRTYFT